MSVIKRALACNCQLSTVYNTLWYPKSITGELISSYLIYSQNVIFNTKKKKNKKKKKIKNYDNDFNNNK